MSSEKLLEIRDLRVKFPIGDSFVYAVNGINLSLGSAETLGIVGESGCGKSVTLASIIRLIKSPPAIISGEIIFQGRDILKLPEKELHKIRGKEITMIFQEPMTSLNPVEKIGHQIMETLILHERMSKTAAIERTLELLELLRIPNAEERIWNYPHQLSGGMRQRVMIAMALACNPKILLADEPTTALDVTIQAQILAILKNIKRKLGTSVIFVTHDLNVVAEIAERVAVFYAGKVVEEADTVSLFKDTLHPYPKGLLGCIPNIHSKAARLRVIPGSIPDPMELPKGCAFCPRCEDSSDFCKERESPLVEVRAGHFVACHRAQKKLS